VSSQTSRLKLRRPERGLAGSANDPVNIIIDWNAAADVLDDGVGAPNYTSGTHSANPYDGKIEYETDTKLLAIWDKVGNQWRRYPTDASSSRGMMGRTTRAADTADFTSASGETGPHMSVTISAEADRRYWVEVFFYLEQVLGVEPANCTYRIRYAAGGAVTTAGTQIGSDSLANCTDTPGRENDFHKIFTVAPGINGNVTFGLFLTVTSGGADSVHIEANAAENLCTLTVDDKGAV